MKVLVTGGAGYIGSHTLIELTVAGHQSVVVDNLSNSSIEALRRVEQIINAEIPFHQFDIRDQEKLDTLFASENFDAVIHFAGLKAVGESVEKPLMYYDGNIGSSVTLFKAMEEHGVKKLVFSSSATVYGDVPYPYIETQQTGIGVTNPYGRTKYMIEEIMKDWSRSNPLFSLVSLRYFNPVGAHPSGLIGDDPQGIPNNLMPFISQAALGIRDKLQIWGNDYDTIDGTGVRDYIHVMDLAHGHVAALNKMGVGFDAINLGSGKGTSVLQLLHSFEKASSKKVPYEVCPRRDGDIAEYYADATKAKHVLGWEARLTIEDACKDTWRWQSQNPNGYQNA